MNLVVVASHTVAAAAAAAPTTALTATITAITCDVSTYSLYLKICGIRSVTLLLNHDYMCDYHHEGLFLVCLYVNSLSSYQVSQAVCSRSCIYGYEATEILTQSPFLPNDGVFLQDLVP